MVQVMTAVKETNRVVPVGVVVATPKALEAVLDAGMDVSEVLDRHFCGDWGDLCKEDAEQNDLIVALQCPVACKDRLLSAYRLPTGTRLWVVTDAGWRATTVLLPEEY